MNLTSIFLRLLGKLGGVLRLFTDKSDVGELQVSSWLRTLSDNHYQLFDNVTLPTTDGTTQIDHIIVSCYGIFVLETKNRQGWLFANKQQKMWTQKLGEQSYSFQNPLHQNYKHVQTLQTLLGIEASYLFSLVVFVGDGEFKTPVPDGVIQGRAVIKAIKSKKQLLLNRKEISAYCQKIKTVQLKPSKKTERQHIQHVEKLVQAKQQKPKPQQHEKLCPKCGKPLLLRTAQRGQHKGKAFLGCSGFPDCRFIA